MYLFYVDESGNRDPNITNGRFVYVLTAVGLFSERWKPFYMYLTQYKRKLAKDIHKREGISLDALGLENCEIKSNWVRIKREREKRPFLKYLTEEEITSLTDAYYKQLEHHKMVVISVVIDKRKLHGFMDNAKLHRKAWELLCERVESFMAENHHKHKAMMITDDMSLQENKSLAVKHAKMMATETSAGVCFRHLIEMPHFVRSELSEGVQLADLCAYNVYRATGSNEPEYPFFQRIKPYFYNSSNTNGNKIDGLKIFPDDSDLKELFK
jgi:hypothetical protein